jgi:hypothetical protein
MKYSNLPSCALLVRGMYDEAPYLPEFFSHYINMGVDHIYYINTSQSCEYLFETVAPGTLNKITILDVSNLVAGWQIRAVSEALRIVDQDWIINVDLDEFLYLRRWSLKQYLSGLPSNVGAVRVPWYMILSDQYVESSVRGIKSVHQSTSLQFKSIGRKSAIQYCSLHRMKLKPGYITYEPERVRQDVVLKHFASRGIYDLINRIVDRNYEDAKSGKEEVEILKAWLLDTVAPMTQLPFRLQLYRVELAFPFKTEPFDSYLKNEHVYIDQKILRSTFSKKMHSIGIDIPSSIEGVEFDAYFDEKYKVRKRLLKDLPSCKYAMLHFTQSMSHQNITHVYIQSLYKVE